MELLQYRLPYGNGYMIQDRPGHGTGQVLDSRPLNYC
jgi:hypothetical protein